MGVRHYVLIAAVAVASCAADFGPPTPVNITVRNRSQFELLDLRFHPSPDWSETPNLLLAPLGVEEALPVVFVNGDYVTAMRRKIEVGEVIAISSAEPLPDIEEGDTLIVFDMSFRIEAAPYVPPEDTSTTTLGSMR
ncbi:MAG: hypothetical protein ACAI38_02365 [Myxococcota bacterium]|nr:hypothetical protein [Myxococcota bacterium]